MLNVAVLVSGGGTNLQAILDAKAAGALPHAKIALVLASKPGVPTRWSARPKRACPALWWRAKAMTHRRNTTRRLLAVLREHRIDVVVLAGFFSILGPSVITAYPGSHSERAPQPDPQLLRGGLLRPAGA